MTFSYNFKTKPAPYQLEALKRALRRGRYGVFFQQRVGKSKVAVDFAGVRSLQGQNKIVIVSPLSVRSVWEEQFADHQPLPYELHMYPKSGENNYKQMRRALVKDLRGTDKFTIVVLHYDALSPTEVDNLRKFDPHIAIFDECHLLKRHTSNRSKWAWHLTKGMPSVLGLTGTPMSKGLRDMFSQFRVIDPSLFGTNWKAFEDEYCVMGGYYDKEIVGYKNAPKAMALIDSASMRVYRKDVMDEPEVDKVIVPVTLEPSAHKLYHDLKKKFLAELGDGTYVVGDIAAVRMMRLQQLCGGFATGDDGSITQVSTAKLEAAVDIIKTHVMYGGEKMIVVAQYSAEVEALVEACTKSGIPTHEFSGRIKEADRLLVRRRFQSDPSPQVVVIQEQTGGMGISFDTASKMLFYSLNYKLDDYQQMQDRLMGRGQKADTVTYYYLTVPKSVDEKVMKSLKNDEDITTKLAAHWRSIFED